MSVHQQFLVKGSKTKCEPARCNSKNKRANNTSHNYNMLVRALFSLSFFLSLFLSFQLITQHVVVVVNLPSQAGTNCGQLYTNVYIHSHQI